MGMLSSSAALLTAHSRSHNPQRRIFQLAREARLARRLGEAQAHERVARCVDQVIAQLHDLAGIAVIQAISLSRSQASFAAAVGWSQPKSRPPICGQWRAIATASMASVSPCQGCSAYIWARTLSPRCTAREQSRAVNAPMLSPSCGAPPRPIQRLLHGLTVSVSRTSFSQLSRSSKSKWASLGSNTGGIMRRQRCCEHGWTAIFSRHSTVGSCLSIPPSRCDVVVLTCQTAGPIETQ